MAVIAAFFFFPIVFGGWGAFFGEGVSRGVSLYEGFRMAYFAFLAVVVFSFSRIRPKSLRLFRNRAVLWFSVLVLATLVLSVWANGTDPVFDLVSGRTHSFVSVVAVTLFALSFSAIPSDRKSEALRALVLGFVSVNLPYALAQSFGLDPVSRFVQLPDWGPGRAF